MLCDEQIQGSHMRFSSDTHVITSRADVTVFSLCSHGSPLSYDREIRADGGSHNVGFCESIWVWRVTADA